MYLRLVICRSTQWGKGHSPAFILALGFMNHELVNLPKRKACCECCAFNVNHLHGMCMFLMFGHSPPPPPICVSRAPVESGAQRLSPADGAGYSGTNGGRHRLHHHQPDGRGPRQGAGESDAHGTVTTHRFIATFVSGFSCPERHFSACVFCCISLYQLSQRLVGIYKFSPEIALFLDFWFIDIVNDYDQVFPHGHSV